MQPPSARLVLLMCPAVSRRAFRQLSAAAGLALETQSEICAAHKGHPGG